MSGGINVFLKLLTSALKWKAPKIIETLRATKGGN